MNDVIIVGVDGSTTASKAAEVAARLAAQSGASLHVVTAFEREDAEVLGQGSDRWVVSAATDAEETAREAATRLRSTVSAVTSTAVQGKPADALSIEAERLNARLIVVGNKDMQGLRRVLGSVANSVAHHAGCDVYIVKTV